MMAMMTSLAGSHAIASVICLIEATTLKDDAHVAYQLAHRV